MDAISLRTVNVFHDSRSEIRLLRFLYVRLFVYDLTSKHVSPKSHPLHEQATNSQYGYALLKTIMHYQRPLCTTNDHYTMVENYHS